MMRTIALLGLLALAGAGLWLAPETVSIMGENIEPVRYEWKAVAVPASACLTSISQDGGRLGTLVYAPCSASGAGGGPSSAYKTITVRGGGVTTAVTGR